MKSLKKYYQSRSLGYGISKVREEKLITLLGKDIQDKAILDIGCSTGYFGAQLMKKGAKVTGIDISTKAIKEAKKVLTEAKVVDLNEGKLPFKNKVFDSIIASELLEHLFQPINILKEAHRILKDGGELIISTPNLLYWGNRLKFMKGEFVYQKSGVFDEGHIHFYTHQTLKKDLTEAGFKIAKENHVFAGSNTLLKVKSSFPGIFAYQFVLVCKKI